MVLSNKKLKQKIRAAKAELFAASEVANKLTENVYEKSVDFDSKSLILKQKLNFSKREKRRQNAVLEDAEVTSNGKLSGDVKAKKQDVPNSDAKEVKKKKRKRDESEEMENVKEKKPQKLKKRKKKQTKKKPKKNVENEKIKEEVFDHNQSGRTQEQFVVKTDESIERKKLEMSLKVYVGGIPYYSTEDDIRSYFEGCGTITSVDCMTFPDSGKFRGIAMITFKTEAAAKRALALDGSDMGGLFLKIQPYKSATVNKLPNFSPSVVDGYNRIYIGNLSWDITEEDLKKLFVDCNVKSIRFGENKETGQFKGYAHVDFADSLSLNTALKLDQTVVCGRPVKISCAVQKKGTGTQVISLPNDNLEDDVRKGNTTQSEAIPKDNKLDESIVGVVIENQVPGSSTDAVSSKIRRRTCYECGERGHLSSSCLLAADKINPENTTKFEATPKDYKVLDRSNIDVIVENQVTSGGTDTVSSKIRRRTCYECGERGHLSSSCLLAANSINPENTTKFEATPKDYKVLDRSNIDVIVENQVTRGGTDTVSSKIRRRTCYECGERGHLSSSCLLAADSINPENTTKFEATPKDYKVLDRSNIDVIVENQVTSGGIDTVSSKIRRRTCYMCGQRSHLSSSCPKTLAADMTNPGNQEDSWKKENATEFQATPKDNILDRSNVNLVAENQAATDAVSSKTRRRNCYECGERGHLSSSCPKKLAVIQ